MLMIAAGYEDGNDAGPMRHDPMFKLAMGRLPNPSYSVHSIDSETRAVQIIEFSA